VDWERRRSVLGALQDGAEPDDETRKLWVTWRLLQVRARRPEAFSGGYEPLDRGPDVCAFRRGADLMVLVHLRGGPVNEPVPQGFAEVLPGLAGTHGISVLERR
jgi:maltooligosyltrehalose synthase